MYAKLPAGTKAPGGYIVPCEVIKDAKDENGGVCGAYVRLTAENGFPSWCQYVAVDQLLNDDEVENEHES